MGKLGGGRMEIVSVSELEGGGRMDALKSKRIEERIMAVFMFF